MNTTIRIRDILGAVALAELGKEVEASKGGARRTAGYCAEHHNLYVAELHDGRVEFFKSMPCASAEAAEAALREVADELGGIWRMH